jgi:hypothetical protein
MVDEKTPEPSDLEKKLNEFIMKYQMDIETLNRILSTYEDKLEIIEKQYYDLSFRFKQFQTNLTKPEESL